VVQSRQTGGGRDITTSTRETYADVSVNTYTGKITLRSAHVTVSTDAAGEKSYTYADSMGRTVRSVSAGIITDTSYSVDGKTILTITMPESYDKSGNVTRQMSASAYDAQGRSVASVSQPVLKGGRILTDDDSVVTTQKYDDQGTVISQTDANGNTVKMEYLSPKRDKVTKVTLPDPAGGNITKIAYTDFTTTTTDANGNISIEKLNDQSETESVIDYGFKKAGKSKIATKYAYNVSGRLARLTYENGDYESYGYDKKGRRTSSANYHSSGAPYRLKIKQR
jgi:YD repeat-containing protein